MLHVLFLEVGHFGYRGGERKWRISCVQTTSSKSTHISIAKLHSRYDQMSGFDITSEVIIIHTIFVCHEFLYYFILFSYFFEEIYNL